MKLLLYCTKAKPYLYKTEDTTYPAYPIGYHTDKDLKVKLSNTNELANLNGKIVGECDFEVEEIFYKDGTLEQAELGILGFGTKSLYEEELLSKSCLSYKQLNEYLRDLSPYGYAIHIKNLVIYDKPKELSDYAKLEKFVDEWHTGYSTRFTSLKQAPQNMCYAYKFNEETGETEKYVVISIRPQWLCKILNGEKTIEVRRKVLKEMLNYD